jgi:Zn-finger nucleic acid-binding protein
VICPTCKNNMIVVEHHQIELDYCPNCQGVWFDSGELELLVHRLKLGAPEAFLESILRTTEARSSEKKRRCPICAQKMKKTTIGEEPKILIDVCERGDGLWFDGGELTQLLKQLVKMPSGSPGSQHHVITFLGEVFQAPEPTTK